jgi:hypothetical protein
MEFSNYPKNHPLYNCDRKKQVGLFQDECVEQKFGKPEKMVIISEYVGLRSKLYSNKMYVIEENVGLLFDNFFGPNPTIDQTGIGPNPNINQCSNILTFSYPEHVRTFTLLNPEHWSTKSSKTRKFDENGENGLVMTNAVKNKR